MSDGAAYLGSFMLQSRDSLFSQARGHNLLDSGAPFYDVYETADGGHVAVAAIEPQFYANFTRVRVQRPPARHSTRCFAHQLLGVALPHEQNDQAHWPATKALLTRRFKQEPLAYWSKLYAGQEACVTPVVPKGEVEQNAQLRARGVMLTDGSGVAAAPLLSRTPGFGQRDIDAGQPRAQPEAGQHTEQVLRDAVRRSAHRPAPQPTNVQGFSSTEIDALQQANVIMCASQQKAKL